MRVLVIDGQGGGLGRQLVAAVKKAVPQAVVTAIGTNSAATSAMLKAGADRAATGENAVVVGCRRADVILGPIGIVMADALLGEITPAMAQAVAQSNARRILIPANRCDTLVVGVSAPIGTLVEQAAAAVDPSGVDSVFWAFDIYNGPDVEKSRTLVAQKIKEAADAR